MTAACIFYESFIRYFIENYQIVAGGFLLGGGVGFLTGLFGAGGGFILVPFLHIFLGLPMNMAVGTSALQVVFSSFFSLVRHMDRGRIPGVGVAVCVGGGIPFGVFPGTWLVSLFTAMGMVVINRREMAAVDMILSFVFALFLLALALWLFYDNFFSRRGDGDDARDGLFAGIRVPPVRSFGTICGGRFSVTVLLIMGMFVGLFSGLLGIGGGVIMMPALYYFVGQDTKNAVKTSTVLVFVAGLVAAAGHGFAGNIDYPLSVFMIAGAFLGAGAGVRMHKKISSVRLRRSFAFVVLAAWLMVIINLAVKIYL